MSIATMSDAFFGSMTKEEAWAFVDFCDELEREVERLCSMPYEEYLRTDHWRRMRMAALERAGHACQTCNAKSRLDVHHRTYENRGCEAPEDLTVLCRRCHDLFHGK